MCLHSGGLYICLLPVMTYEFCLVVHIERCLTVVLLRCIFETFVGVVAYSAIKTWEVLDRLVEGAYKRIAEAEAGQRGQMSL